MYLPINSTAASRTAGEESKRCPSMARRTFAYLELDIYTRLNCTHTVERILESLVTIWPRARNALVRINTGGASRAISTTFSMGPKELLRLWTVPISSASRSTRAVSSSDLTNDKTLRQAVLIYTHPASKTSLARFVHTSDKAFRSFTQRMCVDDFCACPPSS